MHPHASPATRKTITKLGYTVLPDPPCGPDMPHFFHLLGPLKETLRMAHVVDYDGEIQAVKKLLCDQDKIWYRQGVATFRVHCILELPKYASEIRKHI